MAHSRKVVGTFVVADSVGRRFTVTETQDVIEQRTLDGAVHRVPGLKYLHIGRDSVNENADGTYELVRTGAVLRRV